MKLTIFTYSKKVVAALSLMAGLSACEKLIDIPAPITETSSTLVYSSPKLALAALSGAMSSTFNSQAVVFNLTSITALAADELTYPASVNFNEIINNTYTPLSNEAGTSNINSLWADLYAGIYRFNSVIEGVQASTALSDSLKTHITANAQFMRAFCYFYLVNLYRDVPLILQTNVNETALAPKDSASVVYAQIIKDLTEAKAVLPADFSSLSGERTVVTRWAAGALLARVYLYRGQWALAEQEATNVIESGAGLFSVLPQASIADVTVKTNLEAILQFGSYLNATSGYTYFGASFVSTYTQYSLQDTLRKSFEVDDLRGTQWVRTFEYFGTTTYQPYKYKVATNANGVGRMEAPTPLRLAEQYLIRAEARLRLQRGVEGREDMNVVRTRAGLGASTSTDDNVIALEIERENQHEFFCEYGHRWFDLRRTGRINTVLGALKSTWTPRAAWFPLPQAAINANPNLIQNQDYN